MTNPVPLEVKERLGNPGHRTGFSTIAKQATEVPALSAADLPPHLEEHGRALACEVIDSAAYWLARSDAPTVTQLAELEDMKHLLRSRIAAGDDALWLRLLEVTKQQTKLYQLLALTPIDRSRLGLVKVKAQTQVSKLNRFINKESNDDLQSDPRGN